MSIVVSNEYTVSFYYKLFFLNSFTLGQTYACSDIIPISASVVSPFKQIL